MSALKLHVVSGFGRSDVNAGVSPAAGSHSDSVRVAVLPSKFTVNFPVDVEGVLENASAIRTTMVAALLSIDRVMPRASRSDDTS